MRALLLALALAAGLAPGVSQAIEKGVTPYGDFCPQCTNYGICRTQLGHGEAVSAIGSYFSQKGLRVENIKERGRFIKVDVYRGGELVDKVIFDKKTGRLRSIY
ncbi:MAG: hypothetical protein Kow0025_09680 [Thermodesulfovibrionales bacterium]